MPKEDTNMPMGNIGTKRGKTSLCYEADQVLCVKDKQAHTFLWMCLLTGPTQLRTITACLHMAARESGSSMSATMMSTSVLSSGLPAHTHKETHMM